MQKVVRSPAGGRRGSVWVSFGVCQRGFVPVRLYDEGRIAARFVPPPPTAGDVGDSLPCRRSWFESYHPLGDSPRIGFSRCQDRRRDRRCGRFVARLPARDNAMTVSQTSSPSNRCCSQISVSAGSVAEPDDGIPGRLQLTGLAVWDRLLEEADAANVRCGEAGERRAVDPGRAADLAVRMADSEREAAAPGRQRRGRLGVSQRITL